MIPHRFIFFYFIFSSNFYYIVFCIDETFFKGIKVISNAGGINPIACGKALEKVCEKHGIKMNIAVITGDDITDKVCFLLIFNSIFSTI